MTFHYDSPSAKGFSAYEGFRYYIIVGNMGEKKKEKQEQSTEKGYAQKTAEKTNQEILVDRKAKTG